MTCVARAGRSLANPPADGNRRNQDAGESGGQTKRATRLRDLKLQIEQRLVETL
jgi:hypothetical protein